MRKITEAEAIIDGRRKVLGISSKELAVASVGSTSTWNLRMRNPLNLTHQETQRVFRYLHFTKELKEQFYTAMERLGEE